MAEIVIVGGGLTGLSAAYHLEKRNFYEYALYEKEATLGGLCRSLHVDGFTFDYTGHLLHTSDDYFRSFIEDIVGWQHLNAIERKSYIYSHDVFTPYPFQINLHGLPSEVILECIEEFIARPKKNRSPKNFLAWAYQQFGKGIARHFFIPFQRKIFAYDIRRITASWTGRFVPATSLRQLLQGSIAPHMPQHVGYNAHFFYPKLGGIEHLIKKIASRIKNKPFVEHCVKSIDLKDKCIEFTNGSTVRYKQLITTLPLDILLRLIKEPSGSTLYTAAQKLRCNSVVNFNIGINRPSLSDKHWIYFPEKEVPFYRVGFQHNFSDKATPEGCSALYGEFSYTKMSPAGVQKKLDESLRAVKKIFGVSAHEIMVEKIINIPHAYVIFNHWREQHIGKLLKQLEVHDIHSIGRYGAWKYSSMQEAVLDGKAIAEKLTIIPAKKVVTRLSEDVIFHQEKKDEVNV